MFVSVRVSPLAASYRASIASALIREAASPWARNGAVSCAYRVRLCVVSDAVSRVSMQVSATARGRIHIRIGERIPPTASYRASIASALIREAASP